MHEILRRLPPNARLLDLGSGSGSFPAGALPGLVVCVDAETPQGTRAGCFVRADAAALPFRSRTFDAIISNHSLEHFVDLGAALAEVGRAIKPEGALYVAVPDASTVTDILYRWLARGGGHVNAFTSDHALAQRVESATGLRHCGTRPLYTSLSFMNGRNRKGRPPRKLLLFGNGREGVLVFLTTILRLCDRLVGTRLSLYGWALYFGELKSPIDREAWTNVCVRCGSGHPSAGLLAAGRVERRYLWLPFYNCPSCGAPNLFMR